MEKDDEVSGSGNSYTTTFRQYDSRLGRWLAIGPIQHSYSSAYSSFDNNPVLYTDREGLSSTKHGKRVGGGASKQAKKAQRRAKSRGIKRVKRKGKGASSSGGIVRSTTSPSPSSTTSNPGGVSAGESKGRNPTAGDPGVVGPNPKSPDNPNVVQSRLDFGTQIFNFGTGTRRPTTWVSNNSSFNPDLNAIDQIGDLYKTLKNVVNRDAYRVEALEVYIVLSINRASAAAPYTLRNGTVLQTPTAQQIKDDRVDAIRAALIRVGIPDNKIIINTDLTGIQGAGYTVPSTKSGRFTGWTNNFPLGALNSGVIFR